MPTKKELLEIFTVLINDAKNRMDTTRMKGIPEWSNFELWRTQCLDAIQAIYTNQSPHYQSFNNIRFTAPDGAGKTTEVGNLISFIVGLEISIERLISHKLSVEVWYMENTQIKNLPVVFVSHAEKAKKSLEKVNKLLKAIGATPIVLEDLPALGLSPDEKITHYMNQCNVGIALITGDEILRNGSKISKMNIPYEIGLMRNCQTIEKRIIYLKKKNIDPPTGYKDITYGSFTDTNFDEAYLHILKELRGWNFTL